MMAFDSLHEEVVRRKGFRDARQNPLKPAVVCGDRVVSHEALDQELMPWRAQLYGTC
jgi:hypothetical protein